MHILHIYKDYFPVLGGIENHLRDVAVGLAERGIRVTVLVTNTNRATVIEQSGSLQIIKAARQLHVASTPLSWPMVMQARRLFGVDVVHLHFPYPPGDLVARAVPGAPPLVISYHSDIVRQQGILRLYAPLLRATLARAARILVTSPAYLHSSAWLPPHAARCTVLPFGVALERFAAPDAAAVAAVRTRYQNAPLVLFVGRLRYYKGLHFLLEAMPQINQTHPDARLLIVGVGPEQERLQAQAHAAGISERVHFLGEVDDTTLPAIYAAADVFVLPSHLRAEAFGIVQIEAQASGLPIVCAELGTGTSFVTQHGRTGLVVPPADPVALARAITVLLANPDLARTLGAAGRRRAYAEFSQPVMLDRLQAVYQDVVGHA